jgi:hypothetical protein
MTNRPLIVLFVFFSNKLYQVNIKKVEIIRKEEKVGEKLRKSTTTITK